MLTVGDKDHFLLRGSVELLRRELVAMGARAGVHVLSGDPFSRLVGTPPAELAHAMVARFRAWRRGP